MNRQRKTLALLGSTVIVLAFVSACGGGGAEEGVINKFFQASRMRDSMTLNSIATTSFDPRQDGTVQSFSTVSTSEDRKQQLHLKELADEREKARQADDEFTKKKKAYQDANLEAIDRVLKAESKKAKLSGKDVEVQQAWNKWREDTATYSKKLSETREKLNAERSLAEMAIVNAQNPPDVTKMDGEVVTKDVTISAKVKTPDGSQTVNKTLVVTLQRAVLKGDGKEISGRWIVTGVKEAGAGAKTS